MSTLSVDLGTLLSRGAQAHAKPAAAKSVTAKLDVSKARERPAADAAAKDAASASRMNAEQDARTERVQLSEALDRISLLDHRLSFSVDEDSGKSVVIIRDARTSEVLKQFPSEEMLNVARRLEEHLQLSATDTGVLHTDEA